MTISVIAPRLHRDHCRSEDERRFLERLNERAVRGQWYADWWSHDAGHVILGICPFDDERNCVLRTLRADYIGPHLLLGPDETHQFVTDLDSARKDVVLVPDGRPEDLAETAADWFEREMSRQIVREEWIVPGEVRERWLLSERSQKLLLRGGWDAAIQKSLGPPDKRTIVWPRPK